MTTKLSDTVEHGSFEQVALALGQDTHTEIDLASALFTAVRKDDIKLVQVLIEHGANPNHQFKEDWMILHSAVEHEQIDMIRFLVAHGAERNLPDQGGWTPLHSAVDLEGDSAWQAGRTSTSAISKLLLDLGADPAIKNGAGKTALDLARDYGHEQAIALFTSRRAMVGSIHNSML
jgi:ankyrin repeat protein